MSKITKALVPLVCYRRDPGAGVGEGRYRRYRPRAANNQGVRAAEVGTDKVDMMKDIKASSKRECDANGCVSIMEFYSSDGHGLLLREGASMRQWCYAWSSDLTGEWMRYSSTTMADVLLICRRGAMAPGGSCGLTEDHGGMPPRLLIAAGFCHGSQS